MLSFIIHGNVFLYTINRNFGNKKNSYMILSVSMHWL